MGINLNPDNVPDIEYITEKIVDLCKIPSPSGDTREAVAYVNAELVKLGYDPVITNKGGLILSIPGEAQGNERVLSAHLDTLGAMVTEIKGNGRLKLTNIGGFGWATVEGEHVLIKASSGKTYTGTVLINKASSHVWGQETAKTERSQANMEVRIDEKVKTKEDVSHLGIKVGDFVTFDPRTTVTPSGFIKSRHLDDKAAVGVLLGVAKYLTEKNLKPAYTTHFMITVYEETGHGASSRVPENAKEFVAVDMGCVGGGLTGNEFSVSICAKDGGGPYDLRLRKHLEGLCEEKNIPYAVDIYPSYGSDAGAFLRAGNDVRTACLGMGVDASHSHERTHKEGVLATARLALAYMLSS